MADLPGLGELTGPVHYWIGNTHPSTNIEMVEKVLTKCAESLEVENFGIEDVLCLTKDDNPRSRSWRVTVPARLKEAMENPAMYARGWSHRVFNFRPGPRKPEDSGARGTGADGTGATLAAHP